MYRMGQEEINAVARVIESGQLFKVNSGDLQESYNFEKELKEKVGSEYSILMTSGHAALTSALIGMGIGPGDEVIVPAYTYIATAMAVIAAGAVPIIAEIDETLMLDPKDVEKKITPKTKAVIPVHMQGNPCDLDAINAVAKKHGIYVLEDACQAVGGQYKGKYLGTIGDAGAFSFNYFKVISAGEGGALLTNNKGIFEKGLIYHDSSAVAYFGNQMEDFSTETFCGHEFRTNEITAAILREQLKKLDDIVKDLREKKNMLRDALAPYFKFIPSNDYDGCCATSLTLQFDTEEEAKRITETAKVGTIPINTGKHIYTAWDCILNKRGAAHPLFNPFNFEANKGVEYDPNCCAKSLELLKKAAHISININWTKEDIDAVAKKLIDALNA